MKRDVPATEAKHFLDPRSYVALDGREVLYGDDWDARKMELWKRSGGKCERTKDAGMVGEVIMIYICGKEANHADHIVKRSKQRDDRLPNLQALCFTCHRAKHPEFEPRWTKKQEVA